MTGASGRRGRPILALVLLLTSSGIPFGCRARRRLDELSSSAEAELVKTAVAKLQKADTSGLLASLPASVRTPEAEKAIRRMIAEIVPKEPELESRLVDFRRIWFNGARQVEVEVEYRFPATYMLATATVSGSASNLQLQALYVQRRAVSLEEQNAFLLKHRPAHSYIILFGAVLVPIFILIVLVVCIRSPMAVRRKWRWILYISVGFGKLCLNWTTGQIWVEKLAVQLLGASVMAQAPYGPWVVSVSLPVGAFLFLVRRRRLKEPG